MHHTQFNTSNKKCSTRETSMFLEHNVAQEKHIIKWKKSFELFSFLTRHSYMQAENTPIQDKEIFKNCNLAESI